MKMGGSIFRGREDPFGERGFDMLWGFNHREDLTGDEYLADTRVSRAEAYGILARLAPVKGSEWWDVDRATRSFLVRGVEGARPVTCVWQPSVVSKGDVQVYLADGGEHTIHGNYQHGKQEVVPPLAGFLEQLKEVDHAGELEEFDIGSGVYVAENGEWEDFADIPPYRRGARNDEVVMQRAAYLYELVARFTDALDFFVRNVVKENGRRPSDLRDKMVNKFAVPLMVNGNRAELIGRLVGKHLPLEGRVEMNGEIGFAGGCMVRFRELNGGTEWNFVEEETFFPYQGVEKPVRQVEVVAGERVVGGLNNFGDNRLYGRQRNDVGGSRGARLQHFLNENGGMERVVEELGRVVAALEGVREVFEGETGRVSEGVRRELVR